MAADTTKSIIHLLERSLVSLDAGSTDPEVVFNDLKVEDDLHVVGDLTVDGAVSLAAGVDLVFDDLSITGPLEVGTDNAERLPIKGIYFGTVSITVPAITDPDTAPAITDVSSVFTAQPTLGDPVFAVPQADLEANLALGAAHFRATDSLEVTFTSHGGNVAGGAANFTVVWFDVT